MNKNFVPSELTNFWKNISLVQEALLLDDEAFALFIGLDHLEFIKCKNRFVLPLVNLIELEDRLDFDYRKLFSEQIDVDQLINAQVATEQLSDRYSVATYSRTAPIRNILDYLKETKGIRSKIDLLKRFNLSPAFFKDENQTTNIHLISDIVQYLKFYQDLKDQEFIAMGRRTPFTLKSNVLEEKLIGKKNVQETLECFFQECTHNFDRNYIYTLQKLEKDYALIDASPRREVMEELEVDESEFGNETACLTRMGVISSVTWYKHKEFATLTKIDSIYKGGKSNRYLMDLTPFNKN